MLLKLKVKTGISRFLTITRAKCFWTIPSPPSLPLFGHLHLFSPIGPYEFRKLYDAYSVFYHRYGPVVSLNLGVKMVALFDPKDISTLFRNEGKYPSRPSFEALKLYRRSHPDKYSSGGMITENGEEWHRLRQAVHWMLRPAATHPFVSAQEKIADDFVELVALSRDQDGEIQDFLPFLYRYTEESVGLICFGGRMGLLDSNPRGLQTEIVLAVEESLDAMNDSLLGFPWWKIFKTKTYRKLERSQNFMYRIAEGYLKEAESKLFSSEKSDRCFEFLRRLLQESHQLSRIDIQLIVMEIFFAGIDATGNALGFLLYNLARNPQVQNKLSAELKEQFIGDQPITPEILQNLPYLKACIKESHRISPTAGGFARILAQEATFSGYKVPAGVTCIGINPVICKSERYFEDPLNFRPERWLRGENQLHQPFALLPFGHGPRRCIGQRFAEQEMYMCLIKLLLRFHVVDLHQQDVGAVLRLQLTPDRPLAFRFVQRS